MKDEPSLLLHPIEWDDCRLQVFRIYQGMARKDGLHLECSPDHLTAWRLHEGTVTVQTPRRKFEAKAGDWLFLPNGYRRQDFTDGARLTSLMFRLTWSDGRPLVDIRPGLFVGKNGDLDRHVEDLKPLLEDLPGHEWFNEGRRCSFDRHLMVQSWFESWLAEVFRIWRTRLPNLEASRDADPRVDTARRWIADQLVQGGVDVRQAAEVADLSFGHLNRLFMAHHHMTLHGYLEHLRIAYARRRLLDPDTQIKAVAHELGFVDLARFSAWFRRLEQASPREYRHRLGWNRRKTNPRTSSSSK